MSNSEIESKLESLAQAWPAESVARTVKLRLTESARPCPRNYRPRARLYPVLGACAATVVLMAAGLWSFVPRTLEAALFDSVKQAGKAYVLREIFEGAQITKGEIWYHRDHGIRLEGLGQVTVDDGKVSRTWSPNVPSGTVLLRPSMDGVTMISEMLDTARIPSHWKNDRSPTDDQDVAGSPCRAYLVSDPGAGTAGAVDWRCIVLLDETNRPRRLVQQRVDAGEWTDTSRTTIDYDREIAASVFALDYPEDAQIVDVQKGLDARFPLSDAVAKIERDGILFAIHDLLPIDDGSYYVVSSVRGSTKYLRDYPPTQRRFNLNYTALDVVSQTSSHCSVDGGAQVMMFQMEWQGVQYLWWLMVPHNPQREDGVKRIPIPLVGTHLHPNRRDERGVQLQTCVTLETPVNGARRSTLEQAVAEARTDMKLVSAVFGETDSLPIAMSIKESIQFTSFDEITNEAYAAELRKARWQMQTDDFTGADPPKNADGTIAWTTKNDEDSNVEPAPPEPELSRTPTQLPVAITGQVVNSRNEPVGEAKVTVHIRRFNTRQDEIKSKGLELDGPGPWSAVTDDQGMYTISPTGTIRPSIDEVRIKVVAEGYADASTTDYRRELLQGSLPSVALLDGRRIRGRFVDAQGNAVAAAVTRFQSNNADFTGMWDSGPFPVDKEGRFSIAIPAGGKAAGVVYPANFAPRFIDVTDGVDQGDVVLEEGVSLKGRVLDIDGKGIVGTVVGIRNTEYREMYAYVAVIGTAVKTDEEGNFQLPRLSGSYTLSVATAVPDYSRQLQILGAIPPHIVPTTINTAVFDPGENIILREGS